MDDIEWECEWDDGGWGWDGVTEKYEPDPGRSPWGVPPTDEEAWK